MFMLKALLYLGLVIATSIYSILGYQYHVEGYGLHPALCVVALFVITVVCISISEFPSLRRQRR